MTKQQISKQIKKQFKTTSGYLWHLEVNGINCSRSGSKEDCVNYFYEKFGTPETKISVQKKKRKSKKTTKTKTRKLKPIKTIEPGIDNVGEASKSVDY